MNVIEKKSTLAKLLAKENITVTHGNMKTAYFDVKNRILGLPMWKDRGRDVYDMLIGHEVGHALYTPEDAIEAFRESCPGLPFDVCNVVEDIRIERLIKSAYPGLPRLFNTAYSELVEANFFGIADKVVSSLGFVDRLNLRGKIGDLVDIPLSESEEAIYQKCLAAETFEEVLEVCKEIADSNESEDPDSNDSNSEDSDSDENGEESENEGQTDSGESDDGDSEDSDSGDSSSDSEDSDSEDEDDGTEAESGDSDSDESGDADASENVSSEDAEETESSDSDESSSAPSSADQGDLTSETLNAFEKSLENEVEAPKHGGFMPLMMPRPEYVRQQIVSYPELAESRGTLESRLNKQSERINNMYRRTGDDKYDLLSEFNSALPVLKKKTSKKVGVLVREFERRKAAFQYSRSQEARTGVIDVNRLHSYKISDEIFLSKSVLADAKSHGMIFLVDYSGSMAGVLSNVIEQTLNLVEFCKKVGIPFEVYSFTNSYHGRYKGGEITSARYEVDLSNVVVANLLSSKLSRSKYEEAVRNLWCQVWLSESENNPDCVRSRFENLGGTPLNTVLTMMHQVIRDFQSEHRVQKTLFVTLTDGDSHTLDFTCEREDFNRELRVNVNGKSHSISARCTEDYLKMIEAIPNVETIGFFLPSARSKIKQELQWKFGIRNESKIKKLTNDYKKNGFIQLSDTLGYSTYFYLTPAVKIEDEDFSFESDDDLATSKRAQNKLAREFSKHNGDAKRSRVLMTQIAEKVA